MAVIDVITYNGEQDLFDIRYNILKDYVDEFIVIEFDKTFSGKDKPFYFEEIKDKYSKVTYCKNKNNVWHKYMDLAKSSPNTTGAEHWKEEFCQKEYIKDCLQNVPYARCKEDDDIVAIFDCDEIWTEGALHIEYGQKLGLQVYTYYLNNKSSERFHGGIIQTYGVIKNSCLNHLRTTDKKTVYNYGWHFTSIGGHEEVKRKLSDSYTRESYWTEQVENNLKDNVENSKDFLGRSFTYKIDESELPTYLKENKQKYAHLFKDN
jgi:beta-1,4-mannosyl-glycoprotein beta-1,4-N-acetylglucosaminyltransferase